jgi:tetratricopeptide (TPR) repeat protein
MAKTDTISALSDAQAQDLLQQALRHLQQNAVLEAEALLDRVTTNRPDDPAALQLLGTIRRAQNRNDEAETLFRRSLAVMPDQPHVHHNLGELLARSYRFDAAIAEFLEAVRLKPNYTEAHLNLGLAYLDLGRHAEAEKAIRAALRIQPNLLVAQQSLAAVLIEQGNAKEAETILRRALAAGPVNPRQIAALEYNLGVTAMMQRQYDQALQMFDRAQAKVPDMPKVEVGRGAVFQELGQFQASVDNYRKAIARNPLDLTAHRDLNHLLYRIADDENFLRSYDEAMAALPQAGDLPLAKAQFLFMKGDYEKAREGFEKAATLLTASAGPSDGLGLTYARLGEFDAAIRAHERALAINERDSDAWRNYADTLIRAGDVRKAVEIGEHALALDPDNQAALATLSVAFRILDDARGEPLNDFDGLVRTYEVAPPAGFSNIEDFNAALNRSLDELHKFKRESIEQTVRGGSQTLGHLFGKGHEIIEQLRSSIDVAVADYIGRMQTDESHALFRRRRNRFRYSASWSSRLSDCGYHTNHFHPKGWISSAYYVALPDVVADAREKQGWIKFGEPPFATQLKDPIRRSVEPRSGILVLFPSFMYHGTVPFQSPTSRTTIAFDVVPT